MKSIDQLTQEINSPIYFAVDQLEGEEGLDEDKRDPIFPQFYPHQQQNTKVE